MSDLHRGHWREMSVHDLDNICNEIMISYYYQKGADRMQGKQYS